MAKVTFAQKVINVQLSLGSGNFQGGGNTLNLSGLRVSCQVNETSAGATGCALNMLAIYGMTMDQMKQASAIGKNFGNVLHNTVLVTAGDAGGKMDTVFEGYIHGAALDASNMPQARFLVTGHGAALAARQPVAPTTFKGPKQATPIFQQLAKTMGFKFEDAGVTASLMNPYLHGTGIDQCRQLADMARCGWTVDRSKTLAIWPRGKARKGTTLVAPPPAGGMIDYPSFSSSEMYVRNYFDPAIKVQTGITMQSEFTPANGFWYVDEIDIDIESMVPRGKWEMMMRCSREDPSGQANTTGTG